MKIAFVAFEYPPIVEGGAGVYALNLTEKLAKLGQNVHVIAPLTSGSKENEVQDGVFIHRINFIHRKYLSGLSFGISLRNVFQKIERQVGGFDILHGNQWSDFFLTKIGHHIFTVHSLVSKNLEVEKPDFFKRIIGRGENSYALEFAEKSVLKKADLLIANSQYTKRSILSIYGFRESKIKVIYPGVSIKNHSEITLDEERLLRSRLGVEDNPLILFVGRLSVRKGLPFLLQAFQILRKRNIKVKLVVVGDGPEREIYLDQAKRMAIDKDVVFTGFVDKATLNMLYYSSNLVAVPSVNEPFGIVVLEAMLSKKPIVASNSGALPEIVQDNVNGKLVNPQDSFKFAEAMELYLKDTKLAKRIGESNQKKVLENFTWAKNAEQTIEAYKTVIG